MKNQTRAARHAVTHTLAIVFLLLLTSACSSSPDNVEPESISATSTEPARCRCFDREIGEARPFNCVGTPDLPACQISPAPARTHTP